jgi:hypothetical protein
LPGALTQAGANLAHNKVLRNSGTSPTTLYLGLATAVVGATSTLASITEVTTAGYARQPVAFSAPSGSSPVVAVNSADVTFTFSTDPPADPPAISYAFLTDAASGTSGIIFARWTSPAPVDAAVGESLRVAAGALVLNLSTVEA